MRAAFKVIKNIAEFYWNWLKLASPARFNAFVLQQRGLGRQDLKEEVLLAHRFSNRGGRRRAAMAKRRKRK